MKRPRRSFVSFPWGSMKLKRQMYLLYMAVLLIPVLCIGAALMVNTAKVMQAHYIELMEAANSRIRTLLGEVTTRAYHIAGELGSDKQLAEVLGGEYEDSMAFTRAVNGRELLDTVVYGQQEIASIQIYTDNPGISNYKQFRRIDSQVREQAWFQRAVAQTGAFWTAMEGEFASGSNPLCLVKPIFLPTSDYQTVMVIQLSDRYLRSRLDSDETDAVSLDDQGIVYSSEGGWYGRAQVMEVDYSDSYYRDAGKVQVSGKEYFGVLSTQSLYGTPSKLYVCSLSSDGIETTREILRSYVSILLLAIVIPGAFFLCFTAYFTARVQLLREEMHKASKQDYDIAADFRGRDELTEVYEDLKVMIRAIQEKDARMYQAELDRARLQNQQQIMEYKLLAGQINPHYLYNTLETIRMKALTGGDKEVAEAIKILGRTLRYVLDNNGTISTTLDKELSYVEDYLAIQKLRFGERIDYEILLEEGIRPQDYRILPLLLQPVVENALTHGLEDTQKQGRIQVQVCREGDRLKIHIRDNGKGMTEEKLLELRSSIEAPQPPRHSIGLYNTAQRIRLCYGEEYGIRLESRPGDGMRVSLFLPACGSTDGKSNF